MKVDDRSGMRLYGVMGAARSGKTTVADYLQERHGFKRVSFADALKEMIIRALTKAPPPPVDAYVVEVPGRTGADLMAGIPKAGSDQLEGMWRDRIYVHRTPFTRWVMQFIGTEIFRDQVDEGYWVKEWLKVYYQTPGDIVVPDVRFPNEADCIRRLGGEIWKTVRLDPGKAIEHGAGHRSETEAELITPDRTLEAADGIEHLHKLVDGLCLSQSPQSD